MTAFEHAVRRAYQAYGDRVGWKNYANLPMPQFQHLPPKIQEAWRAAVEAALNEPPPAAA